MATTNQITTSLLLYDIPETSNFPNPSAELRQHALRINKSCWVVDNERTPWGMLNQMTQGNVLWHLIPFAPEATQDILNIAATVMRADLDSNKVREQESIDRATVARDEVLNNSNGCTWREQMTARAKYDKAMKAIRKRTEKVVTDLEKAAKRFGLNFANLPVRIVRQENNRTSLEGMRALNQARAEAITTAAPIVNMDENTPAPIMADALDEREEGSGETLRSLYTNGNGSNGSHSEGSATDTSEETTTEIQTEVQPMESVTTPTIPTQPIRSSVTEPQQPQTQPVNGTPSVRREAVTYTCRTHNGMRQRISTLTDREAAEELYQSRDSFPASLASRVMRSLPLTPSQRSWLHVLAVESRERKGEVNPPVDPDPTPEVGIPVIGTRHMDYNETNRRLRVEAAQIGWAKLLVACGGVPTRLDVQSHRTNKIVRFGLTAVIGNGTSAEYEADDGTTLLVHSI